MNNLITIIVKDNGTKPFMYVQYILIYMEIKLLNFIDKALYIRNHNILVLSDLHLGYKNPNLRIPELEYKSVESRLKEILLSKNIEEIVFNGDTFSEIPDSEKDLEIFDNISDKVDKIVFTIGNHEDCVSGFPKYIVDNYEIKKQYNKDNICFLHGHNTPIAKSDNFVIGHLHPTIGEESVFLFGEDAYYNSDVVVCPAFSDYINGTSIRNYTNYNGHCPILADGKTIDSYRTIR
jgi:metallophosphoesterase superfamily enzyme